MFVYTHSFYKYLLFFSNRFPVRFLNLPLKMTSSVQSVLLSRNRFKTRASARKYAREHGFKTSKIDVTERYFRFRQANPRSPRFKRFRTISRKGGNMKLIIGFEGGRSGGGRRARRSRRRGRRVTRRSSVGRRSRRVARRRRRY